MAVYVDKLQTKIAKRGYARFVGERNNHQWCHMWADTLDDLHEMADKIGMKREWFQNDHRLPHYDLVPSRRRSAVLNGAIEVGLRELVDAIKKNSDIKQSLASNDTSHETEAS